MQQGLTDAPTPEAESLEAQAGRGRWNRMRPHNHTPWRTDTSRWLTLKWSSTMWWDQQQEGTKAWGLQVQLPEGL